MKIRTVLAMAMGCLATLFSGAGRADGVESPTVKVGETAYASLEDAVDAATDGSTITVLDDIRQDKTLTINGKSLTLDLNGKTLTVATDSDGIVVQDATLNLGNSGTAGKFVFECTAGGSDGIFLHNTLENGVSTLNINSDVEISFKPEANSAIHAYGEAGETVVNMNAGSVCAKGEGQRVSAVIIDQNSAFNMKGGTFDLNVDFDTFSQNNDVVGVLLWGQNGVQKNSTVKIDGGTFNVGGKNAFAQAIQVGMKNGKSENVSVEISGGEIVLSPSEDGQGYVFAPYNAAYASAKMSGGSVRGTVTALTMTTSGADTATMTVSGGSFTFEIKERYCADGFELKETTDADGNTIYGVVAKYAAKIGETEYETLDAAIKAVQDGETIVVNAGEYKLNGSLSYAGKAFTIKSAEGAKVSFDMSAAVALHGAKVTFTGVTFDYKTNDDYTGLQHTDTLVYNNCTINGKVFLYAASETFNKCTFVQTDEDYNLWTYSAKSVTFNECTFKNAGKTINAYIEANNASAEPTKIELADCKVEASKSNKAVVNIKNKSQSYEIVLSGNNEVSGIEADGTTKSAWYQVETTDSSATDCKGVTVAEVTEDGTKKVVYEVSPYVEGVAKIGTMGYATLEAALAAANAGDTVTLLADVELTAKQTISKAMTLDLNGKNISSAVDEFITIENGGDLTINDATNEGSIENTSTSGNAIKINAGAVGGILTLTGGAILAHSSNDAAVYSQSIGGKNMTINVKGGRIENDGTNSYAVKLGSATGTINVTGGEMVGGQYGLYVLGYNFVNIFGGVIQGKTKNAVYSANGNTITISGGTLTPGGTAAALAINGGSCTVTIGREDGKVDDVTIPSLDVGDRVATMYLLSGTIQKFLKFGQMTVATVSQGKEKLLVGTDISTRLPGSNLLCRKDEASGLYEIIELTVENASAVIRRNGEDVPYNTIEQAARAVADGETLTLKTDYTGSLAFTAKNITIDLGGHTLTYTDSTGGAGQALLINQSADADNTVTVKNGTIVAKGQDDACISATSDDVATTLTLVLDNVTFEVGSDNRRGKVVLEKGARTKAPCEAVNNGGLLVTEGEEQWIYGETATAFTHANGEEVTLLNNWYNGFEYSGTIKVPETSSFATAKLNLGGHTIKAYGGNAAIVMGEVGNTDGKAAKTLEISNGSLITSLHGAAVCGSNKTLTLDGVSLTTTGDGNLGIYTNGMTTDNTITLKNGSTVVSEKGTGIYFPGTGTLTVADSSVTGALSGIEVRAGTLNVLGTSVIESTAAEFAFANNDNGITTTGAAVAAVKHTVGNDLTVNISGGTFKGVEGFYEYDPNADKEGTVTVAISGGTFSAAIDEKYCAEGFVLVANDDGTFSVKQVVSVAQVGETKYSTLAEAIAAAVQSGETVELLADVEVKDLVLSEGVTIKSADAALYEIKGLKAITGKGVTLENVYLNLDQTLEIGGTDTTLNNCVVRAKDVGYGDIVDGLTTGFTGGKKWTDGAGSYLVRVTGTNVALTDCLFDGTDKDEGFFPNMCLAPVSGTNVTMTRCTFNEGFAACWYSTPHGTWTLDGCKFTKIYCYNIQAGDTAANIVVKNCELAGWTSFGSSMESVSFEKCSFAKSSGASTIVAYKDVTFTDCSFTEDYKDNLYLEANTTAELNGCKVVDAEGNESTTVSLADIVEPDAETGFAAIDATKGEDGKYTDGQFVGVADAIQGRIAEDRALAKNEDGSYALATAVAQIGTARYASLAEAIAAAQDGDTVTLLADVTETNAVNSGIVYDITGVTIDLNGHTYSQNNFAHVFQGTGGVIKNGKMVCLNGGSYALHIGDEGETTSFTVEDVELTGGINIFNASGVVLKNLTVNGSDYYAVWMDNDASATIESGTYTAGAGAVLNGESSSVLAISGGIFNSNGNPLMGSAGGTLQISGGQFDVAIDEKYCAPGFIPTENEDGTYGVKAGTYVAAVGETKYEAIAEAIAAAKSGDTITLLADVVNTDYTVANVVDIKLASGVTLDGNGKTISGNVKVTVASAGDVAIKNANFKDIHNAAVVSDGYKTKYGFSDDKVGMLSAIYASKLTGALAISGCSFENCDWEAMQITPAEGAKIDIRNNVFRTSASEVVKEQLRHVHVEMAYGTGFDYEGTDIALTITDNQFLGETKEANMGVWWVGKSSTLDLTGNYYANPDAVSITLSDKSLKRENRCDLIYPARSTADVDVDDLTAVALVVKDAFNATAHATLAAAIAAAQDGETVKLLADATEDVTITKSITLDLNGKTLTNTNVGKATVSIAAGAVATVKNGSVIGGTSYYTIEVTKNSAASLTLEDVTATAGNTGSSMIDNWGTLTINSGTYTGGLDVVKSEEGSALTITGGTFTLDYAKKYAFNAVILVYGDTTITGGTFIQNAKTASAYPQVVMTGIVEGYTAITKITGGTFVNNFSGTKSGIFWALGDAKPDNFEVSGGTFNKTISEDFCADGFIPTKNADGTYGVKEGSYVAQIGSKKYETLADAIRLATKGKTVTLLADVTEDISITKSITLDLNGKTLTNANAGKATLTIAANATVTVKNGNIVGGTSYYTIVNLGTATFEGVVATAGNVGSSMLDNKGTLTINSGTYTGGMNTVKNEPNATLTINGGTFENSYGENNAHTGVIYNLGNVEILGGEFVQKATTPAWAYPHVIMTAYEGSKPSTVIKGGTFTSTLKNWRGTILNYDGADSAGCTLVSGGVFNMKIDAAFCAPGYIPAKNADGTFGVQSRDGTQARPYSREQFAAMTRAEYIAAQKRLEGTMYVEVGDYSYEKDGVLGNGVRNDTPGQIPDHSKLNAYGENGYLDEKNDGANGHTVVFVGGTVTSGATGYENIDNIGTSLLLAVPAYTTVKFEKTTFNKVMSFDYQLYTVPWSQLQRIEFNDCTFNGLIVGAIASTELAFTGCTFTDYRNSISANNSNPTWIRPAYGNWSKGDNTTQGSDFRSLTSIIFENNTVTSTRPVKFERIAQWEMATTVTASGNTFDITPQEGDTEPRNVGLYLGANAKFDLVVGENTKSDATGALFTTKYTGADGLTYDELPAGSTVKDLEGNEIEITDARVWKSETEAVLKTMPVVATVSCSAYKMAFSTFEQAYASAAAKTSEATITLAKDAATAVEVSVAEGKALTLDLNGCDLVVKRVANAGTLNVLGGATGLLTAADGIDNTGALLLQDGLVDAKVISSGDLSVIDADVSTEADGYCLTITGGTATLDVATCEGQGILDVQGGKVKVHSSDFESTKTGLATIRATAGTLTVVGETFVASDDEAAFLSCEGTAVVSLVDGKFTGDIVVADGATKPVITGGRYRKDLNQYCAEGYTMKEEDGWYGVVISVNSLTPAEGSRVVGTEEEADNIIASGVGLTAAVDSALTTDEAKKSYKDLFELSKEQTEDGKWLVSCVMTATANAMLTAQVDNPAMLQAIVKSITSGERATLTGATPGLYYSVVFGTEPTKIDQEVARFLANSDGTVVMPVSKPNDASDATKVSTKGFYRLRVSVGPKAE